MKLSSLFKHTAIYGIATVLPRILNLILTPLHIDNLEKEQYGVYQGIFAYMILGNVLLTYGMETAFFRFINKETDKENVKSTTMLSIVATTFLFFILFWIFKSNIAFHFQYSELFIKYAIGILALDTLVAIPLAWLRNEGKSVSYTIIKTGNVFVNLIINVFYFKMMPDMAKFAPQIYNFLEQEDLVTYIFIANFIASLMTFLVLLPIYFKMKLEFSFSLWKKMIRYALPILIAGIAFSINEAFDRIFIRMLYPPEVADATVGIYSACYKMGVFMTLFITAYKLGIEPFFFSTAQDKNAPKSYAKITRVFIIFGSFILLFVSVYTDILKRILIPNPTYWEALWIVPFVLFANLCLGIYHSLSVWYKITDKTHYGAVISIVGGVVTIVANLALIPLIGYRGAAIATLLAYATMMTLSFVIGQKKYPIPYNLRKIGLYLLFSVGTTMLNFYLLNRNMITGTLFLFLFVGIVYFSEKKKVLK
ncbi:oligosaccharide flippase family protein [Capnocytophaga catalasegens]|uniref:Polysaccharide biosynthesis protein n=1 Tax=Capnocytophaga catalasegens TaxID=1004260 RepID=A0AAV5ASP1_9FLAO|nr:oligosaccharide flippase family protein [Capnocytophaga catalasegens]GIZ15644.1 polysaccharide biosynthesis protein [Capnocytophaga catalasegens]GJM49539.1 polysaccharide biosynthesis protein [Capnocytophaga catalasegens]GJM51752.1 polysaccharide biosynthesis protein [Capnocytophaga catalasegens]